MAHITGGGFVENVPRILPDGLGCFIDVSTWTLPPVFRFLIEKGGVEPNEMARTFNNGIGLVIVVGQPQFDHALQLLRDAGPASVFEIGKIIPGRGVDMRNLSIWRENS
jgi:phosphoribosylamine--glycine ligase/phosphoribosylformylglycinamidine cyclo-ligase